MAAVTSAASIVLVGFEVAQPEPQPPSVLPLESTADPTPTAAPESVLETLEFRKLSSPAHSIPVTCNPPSLDGRSAAVTSTF
jgi:hypothetical protein